MSLSDPYVFHLTYISYSQDKHSLIINGLHFLNFLISTQVKETPAHFKSIDLNRYLITVIAFQLFRDWIYNVSKYQK